MKESLSDALLFPAVTVQSVSEEIIFSELFCPESENNFFADEETKLLSLLNLLVEFPNYQLYTRISVIKREVIRKIVPFAVCGF